MAEDKHLIAYSTDASQIQGKVASVLFPKSVEEIRQAISIASNIVIRGGASGLAGGAVPNNSIVLDMSKMNRILNLDKSRKIVEVEAGAILDELNEHLSSHGLEFPVNPLSSAVCTIGGIIATNAIGSRAVKYRRTSEWVESLEVVNGKNELLTLGKADVSDFCGMEGITGVIVKAKLRLIEKKERTASLFSFDSLERVVYAVRKLKLLNDICAIEFLDKFSSGLIGLEDKYHLIIEFESGRGNAKNDAYRNLRKLLDKVYPSLAYAGYTQIESPKILLHKFQELAEFLESNKVPFFGHIAAGIINPVFQAGENEKITKMLNLVKRLQGQVTSYGIGLKKKEFVELADRRLLLNIKKRHDPLCKINHGKIVDSEVEEIKKESTPSELEEKKTEEKKEEEKIREKTEESIKEGEKNEN